MVQETREQVLDLLREVPATVDSAEHARETFNVDKPLQDRVIELYISILRATDGAIAYLVSDAVAGEFAMQRYFS